MIQYGSDRITELKFKRLHPALERRDWQWVDITLRAELAEETPLPEDLIDFTILVICAAASGTIVQIIPQDEGCDCEYQFTFSEKEQLRQFIEQDEIQQQIINLPIPN